MYITINFSDKRSSDLRLPHYILAAVLTVYIFFVNFYSISVIIKMKVKHEKFKKIYNEIKISSDRILKNIPKDPSKEIEKINDIINKRNFSWTQFLNTLEQLTSAEIKISSVSFSPDDQNRRGRLIGIANNIEILTKFINSLNNNKFLDDIFLKRQIILDDTKIQFEIYYNWNNIDE